MISELLKLKDALLGLLTYLKANAKQEIPSGHLPAPEAESAQSLGLLIPLAKAIQSFEGFYPGSTSFRNNNPGNMRWSAYSQSLGAISGTPTHFAVFPDCGTGFKALCQFITDAANDKLAMGHNLTLQTFMDHYAPVTDGNDPSKYARFIAKSIGVNSVDLPLKQIV